MGAKRRGILAGVALAIAGIAATPGACSADVRELYVSGTNDPGFTFYSPMNSTTVAYTVSDGRLSEVPVRTYGPNSDGPVAVDAAGRLYASQYACAVDVFASHSLKVERRLEIEGPCNGGYTYDKITAIAVDRKGDLFVSIAYENDSGSAAPRPSGRPRPSYPYVCSGSETTCTLAYAPDAQGTAAPLQIIDNGIVNYALATDPKGNLYVQEANNEVDVIADPTRHPHRVRRVVPRGYGGASNPVVDDEGHLYLGVSTCTPSHDCVPAIAVFPETAHGIVAPERVLSCPLDEQWWNFTLAGAVLYEIAGGPTVETYDRFLRGPVSPAARSFLSPTPTVPLYIAADP
jgi:hypothetical protein